MSSRKDDNVGRTPETTEDDRPLPPGTVPVDDDDTLSPLSPGNRFDYPINPTRGYLEVHGDVHKGQDPPEEKD